MNNHFKIIIPLYNVEKWIKVCLRSVRIQSYKNFECIILDDMSTDNTSEIIKKEIANDPRFKLISNTEKAFALKNIYDGINISNPKAEDIIVTLDGDDWFSGKDVLKRLNEIFIQQACWITYGSYAEYPGNRRGKFSKKIPDHVVSTASFRKHEWCSSHLRTFKFHLWNKIKKADLLDSKGQFYRMTWDLAFMFPMLEMASSKSHYVEDIMYIYNVDNPLNDHKVDNSYQRRLESEIRSKNPYSAIPVTTKALELMTFNRFDIAAKTIYAQHYLKNTGIEFHKEIYLNHLEVWNNFHEKEPRKNTQQDFLSSFHEILVSIKENCFLSNIGTVPVFHGLAVNGAHRIASCIAMDKDLDISKQNTNNGQLDCGYKYFKNKKDFVKTGLQEIYSDEMALEFCRRKKNLFTISLFPSHGNSIEEVSSLIEKNVRVIYAKDTNLTENGQFNYIHNLYYNESWIGPKSQGHPGVREKKKYCFDKGSNIRVFLIEENNPNRLLVLKEQVRSLCGVGKHSVHINDTQEETWRIASCVYNKNSLHFLNNRKNSNTPNFDDFLSSYRQLVLSRTDRHDFCVDSSAVLSAYGLRDCRDLDFLHLNNIHSLAPQIDCHNDCSHHYVKPKNKIIYNPRLHFYVYGLKFASIEVVKEMKMNRNEEKDKVDVKLMEGL